MLSKQQCRNLHEDPDKNICDLPAKLMLDLKDCLDSGPETANWRAFVDAAAKLYKRYTFSYQDIEMKFGNRIYNDSPSKALINELGALNMTAEELTRVLDQLKLERILMHLKKYEQISIIHEPAQTTELTEGDVLRLEVDGVGFPYPRYQWFKLNPATSKYQEVRGANLKVIKIEKCRYEDSGTYCCRLHNGKGNSQVHFSQEAVVIVKAHQDHHHPIVKIPDTKGCNHAVPFDKPVALDRTQFYRQKDVMPEKAVLPYILEHPKSLQIMKGANLVLNCQALGRPPLTYEWYRNGQYYSTTEDSYIKIPALSNQIGTYFCLVKNTFGEVKSKEAIVTVSENVPEPVVQAEIEIISNPKSCTVEFGGSCIFNCEARCRGLLLRYEWYKDGRKLQGQCKSELRLDRLQDMEQQGNYMCMVSVPELNISRHSNIACLIIKMDPNKPPEFNPTDKVALLIGNYDYKNETELKAPETDVSTLAQLFRHLDFKVVTLLNLTKTEMLSAVDYFSELLGKGVYAVFYFCGHGFEEDGKCYFVPPDAKAGYTIEDCVSAENVLYRMQKPEPDLIVLILDICRIRNRVESARPNMMLEIPHKGNTVFCYATSTGMYAYEDAVNGILVKYLQKFIVQDKGVLEIFSQVQEAIGREPKHYKLQIPELRSNLLQPKRSLADKISTKGATKMYHQRTLRWLECHQKPEKRLIEIPELQMELEMEFQSDFSNVLHVITTVKKTGITSSAVAFILKIPSAVSLKEMNPKVTSNNPTRTKSTLQEIQKLTEDLMIDIGVKYSLKDQTTPSKLHTIHVNLGLPLVAVLKLWKPIENEAMEHEDFSDKNSYS
ncbi:mucosa-associated lymphoid tissue lymphoma translocation protein 1-like [Ostrea edulis]|uniref:mucosa-associated lymphoid tissue lymphoma translocation protein 1-like n=1 Tax=Ostrea edulis TaxID=37623 RepID=UPI0024AF572B|nr:mucosa-associated lymphoid tissue lymphoma translocation protein 1-like [Ostrea edulis]